MQNFWQKLKKPIYALAPMADVTDTAFRQMFVRYGKPDVMFTEFVSTDGLCSVGRENLMRELQYDAMERPIVAQIWGARPEHFYDSAQIISRLGFDGIDINMGCPQEKEIKHGACAALINHPQLAHEIIRETKRGANGLPVSVKTRIGYTTIQTEAWIGKLLEAEPVAITIHARTKKELSDVPAHWDEVRKAVQLRNRLGSKTLILGNGDIKSLPEADQRIASTGVDGVMVGRGAFGNPWFFNRNRGCDMISVEERLRVMLEHARLYEQVFAQTKSFAVMRKHFKAYASGFDGAKELRAELMQAKSAEAVSASIDHFLKSTLD